MLIRSLVVCAVLAGVTAPGPVWADLSRSQCQALQEPTSDLAARMGDLWGQIVALDLPALRQDAPDGSPAAGALERAEAARVRLLPALQEFAQATAALSQHMEACSRR